MIGHRRIAVVPAVLLAWWSAGAAAAAIPVVEHSRSMILRATHILVIEVGEVDAGPWSSERHPATRQVRLEVRVTEVLKGRVSEAGRAGVRLRVTRHRMPRSWRSRPVYRPWSEVRLVPGVKLVAFARSKSTKLERVLDEQALLLLHPPSWPPGTEATPVLPAVRLARRAEAESWSLLALLRNAGKHAARLESQFLAYMWQKLMPPLRADANGIHHRPFGENPLADRKVFEAVLGLAEAPGLDRAFRLGLVGEIGSSLFPDDDTHDWHVHRYLRLMFRLLPMLDEEDARHLMERDIIGYLRLDRPDWGPARNPKQVFGRDQAAKHRARRALARFESAPAHRLRAWLDGGAGRQRADDPTR